MIISKLYEFEYAHIVREAFSKRCKYNYHGHSAKVKVFIGRKKLNKCGMVIDFGELKPIKEFIDLFDHTSLFWEKDKDYIIDFFKNNFDRVLVMKKNTTAENMARLIMKFTSEWLFKYKFDVYCYRVELNETRTGCGIAEENEYDDNDILVYQHKNEY